MREIKFKDVKVGDELLIDRHHYSDRQLYKGVVTKVTGTRFTVDAICFGQGSQVFTKDDGREYPRSTGYGRLYVDVKPLDDEGRLMLKKYRMHNKARKLANQLTQIFEGKNFRDNVTTMDMNIEELDESIKMLEDTHERFKKYGPKEET